MVAKGRFRVDVGFPTLKSWSLFSGHHCSNLPTLVSMSLMDGRQILVQKDLKFNDSFDTHDSLTYVLNHQLVIDAANTTRPARDVN